MRLGIKLLFLPVLASAIATTAAEDTAFDVVFSHYEPIRQALIEDSTDDIASHAAAIADAGTIQELLPEIAARARSLQNASRLANTRLELSALTQELARWHQLIEGPRPVVAYCPMEKMAWLQPDEPIGNPYAPSMLRCGEVVQR